MNKVILTHKQSLTYISIAFGLTVFLMLVNFFASYVSNSLALFADGTHLLVHNSSLLVALTSSIVSYKLAKTNINKAKLVDIIGGFINCIIFLSIAVLILKTGFARLDDHASLNINPIIMMVISTFGCFIHCISAYILNKGRKHSFNVHAIFLHTIFDAISTILTFIASLVILFTNYAIADTIASFLIAIFVTYSGLRLLRQCIRKALFLRKEATLINNINKCLIANIPHIRDIHEQEIIWHDSSKPASFSAHIVLNNHCVEHNHDEDCLKLVNKLLKSDFNITGAIIQLEYLS